MTAPHIVDPAGLLSEALSEASPDMMRSLLQTMINALLSADADAVVGAEYGRATPGRAAQRNGTPLGAWARIALDRMLIDRMYASCRTAACTTATHGARIGLAWNTWRQYGGPPARGESLSALVHTTVERALVDPDEREVRR